MSILNAEVIKIQSVDSLNIITFKSDESELSMMGLELLEGVCVGSKVSLFVKPMSVALAKDFSGMISYTNQLSSKIKSIEEGKLLSSVKLLACGNMIESIITTSSLKNMKLSVGDAVVCLIKANELSIIEVIK